MVYFVTVKAIRATSGSPVALTVQVNGVPDGIAAADAAVNYVTNGPESEMLTDIVAGQVLEFAPDAIITA